VKVIKSRATINKTKSVGHKSPLIWFFILMACMSNQNVSTTIKGTCAPDV